MGTLSYTATMSLDGYVADNDGDFQWAAPSEDVFRLHVERMSEVSTEVLGRRTYELMRYWETAPEDGSWSDLEHEFAERWRHIDHVVASSSLDQSDLGPGPVRLVPRLDLPALEQIVAGASGEVEIFGPTTAREGIRAGLVRDFRFFVAPTVVGGGLRAIPADARLDLRLVEQRTFAGTVYLHYQSN